MLWQCWQTEDGLTFSTKEGCAALASKGLLGSNPVLLYELKAKTYNEAMQAHYDLQGWGIYKP